MPAASAPPRAPASRPAPRQTPRATPAFWRRHHRLLRALALVAVFGAFVGLGGLFASWTLVCRGGACPAVESLAGYTPRQTSKLFAADGRFVAEIGNERRTLARVQDIPEVVRQAFLVTEDKRFYSHGGIDWRRVPGAVFNNIRARRWKEGFSTITMQLARNVFSDDISRDKTLVRKLREARVARDIERRYSKDQILELYLNQIYLGAGAYGVETAAQRYFGKGVRDLNLAEAATLAALPKGPERYNPRRFPDRAVQRRNTIIELMRREGIVSDADASLAKAYPLQLATRQEAGDQAPYFVEWVRQLLEQKFGRQLYEDGLKVYTTLDPDMQGAAERALEAQLRAIEAGRYGAFKHPTFEQYTARAGDDVARAAANSPYLQGAFVALDPRTGAVRALVGGRDFDDSKFNRATQALRQPGSSFKPVVYAAAVQNGRVPSTPVDDDPITLGDWSPKNFDGRSMGVMPMRRALYLSRNLAMVHVGNELGPQAVVGEARRFGISTPIPGYPAIYLGAASVYPLEMIAAYSAFATLGTRAAPYAIVRVEDRNGEILWQPEPVRAPVMSPEEAYLMVSMMKDVNRRGTAAGAVGGAGFDVPSGGKTGTTNDGADAWYIGYTPDLVAGVWVGMDRPQPIKRNAQGGELAAPAWTAFMTEVYRRKPAPRDWPMPAGIVEVLVVAGTNLRWEPECVGAEQATELFIAGMEPAESCDPNAVYGSAADSARAAGDSTGAFAPGETEPAPAGRRATVPAPDLAGDSLGGSGGVRRRRPIRRDTLLEQTAPSGARPTVPFDRR